MRIIIGIILALSLVSTAVAEEQTTPKEKRRGLITSGACPLGCKDFNLPANLCREFRSGDKCSVEDFSQPPGHRSMIRVRDSQYKKSWSEKDKQSLKMKRRGLITTASCPYTCKDAGAPKGLCRESRSGDLCRVEDFSQVPGHRSMIRVPVAAYKDWSSEDKTKLRMKTSRSDYHGYLPL